MEELKQTLMMKFNNKETSAESIKIVNTRAERNRT